MAPCATLAVGTAATKFKSLLVWKFLETNFSVLPGLFDRAKKAIADESVDKQIVGIAMGRAIIIGRVEGGLEGVARREELELLSLLSRVEKGTLSEEDRRFLDRAREPERAEDMRQWRYLTESIGM